MRGRTQTAIRVTNVNTLGLTPKLAEKINKEFQDNKMLWELWVESADTYDILRKNLKARGYSQIPVSSQPVITATSFSAISGDFNVNRLPDVKTMLKRGS